MNKNIIIATIKEWNISNYFKLKDMLSNKFNLILLTTQEELTISNIKEINPEYIFFPHWSWKISKDIFTNYKCIIFHETDLPYGRGGSPIQNLILNEKYNTKISAIECIDEVDAGDIYLQECINISKGNIEDIFMNISDVIFFKMIPKLIQQDIFPVKQDGKIVMFNRRKPEDSNVNNFKYNSIGKLYDFIRMVDSNEYPRAFLEINNLKMEFSEVYMENNKLIGKFEVIENE